MNILKLILPLLLFALLTNKALSNESQASHFFDQGNSAYEKQEFEQAQKFYEKTIELNMESASLYYNLGNTYFRLGKQGWARLWYERALEINPRHKDTKNNLDLILKNLQEEPPSSAFQKLGIHQKVIFWVFFIINFSFFVTLTISLFLHKEWIWWGKWVGGILLCFTFILMLLSIQQGQEIYGIIITPRSEVRIGPGSNYRVGFIVPEAQKITIISTRPQWVQIGVSEKGLKGWILSKDMRTIPFIDLIKTSP